MIWIYLIILILCVLFLLRKKVKENYNRDGKIKVYCINRLSRPDRREKFLERFKKFSNFDIDVIDAVDKTNLHSHNNKLKRGEIGCYLSHIQALFRLLSTGKDVEYALIFEDDGVCNDNLENILQKGFYKNYDLFILGNNYHDSKSCKEGICQDMNVVHGAHAYLINKKGANKLIKKAFPIKKPYDLFYVQKENGLKIGLLETGICNVVDITDCETQG